VGRAARQKGDIDRAQQDLAALQEQLAALEQQFQADAARLQELDAEGTEIVEKAAPPRKTDIAVRRVALVWLPHWVDDSGVASPA
jgi:chromosome segregation ATPase